MKRSYWKRKLAKGGDDFVRRAPISRVSKSPAALIKVQIQATLREIVIIRDGGCILRNYKFYITNQYRECGGWRKDGELILQAEHLHTRGNAASYADTRLVVCLCQRHHGYYKPQHSDEYYRIVKKHIGPQRTKLLEAVQSDRTSHKVDMALELVALKQELHKLKLSTDTDLRYANGSL